MIDSRGRELKQDDSVVVIELTNKATIDSVTIEAQKPTLFFKAVRVGRLVDNPWRVFYEGGTIKLTPQGCCGFAELIYKVPKVGE